ncbi:SDR family NAD(P)-dependent oxidoreductase [Marinimicrococcus flavescens]|uniref:Glucose 1-dehydrogenase n=1 Tax=Marinimicrococcus flavescens TaxID=3031815 RepID=A0AAP3UZ17_9PROT|nr:glucose 1-dehydrogenase [Marinimicrococcus flavescens]
MNRFAGKTALVTGAGRGIGRAIATRLAREGAAVAVLDIDLAAARKVAEELRAAGARATAIEADVADEAQAARAAEAAEAALGPLDVLVNNAAWAIRGTLAATGPADWDREVAVTLRGPFLLSRAVVPGMSKRGRGAIVMIASVNGLLALGNPAYSAAKAGLLNLTRSLAVEYGPAGIRTNAVSPGSIRTEHPTWQEREQRDPAIFEKLARWYPVGRIGRPEDIAAAVAFLAAEEAGFVNGANLVVDGGLTAGMAPMMQELTGEG